MTLFYPTFSGNDYWRLEWFYWPFGDLYLVIVPNKDTSHYQKEENNTINGFLF
jgi:hypothetical protein